MNWLREDGSAGELNRAQILEAVDKSLKDSKPIILTCISFIGPTDPYALLVAR